MLHPSFKGDFMDWKKISAIITVVLTVTVATSGYLTSGFGLLKKIDGRYAKASEFQQLSVRVQWVGAEVKLNYLHFQKTTAFAEYFAAKKLKKAHPKDEEVAQILEKAIEDKNILTAEYLEQKRKVASLLEKLQK